MKEVVIIGYGGHGYVAADILQLNGYTIIGYCDHEKKPSNPFNLPYLGSEVEYYSSLQHQAKAFISIGNAAMRKEVWQFLGAHHITVINAVHPKAVVAESVQLGKGIMVAANATINPICSIGNGVIINTSASIDHECTIGSFSHICPGSVLCGNVNIGHDCFIGANTVIRPGITIADHVMIGAGSVVVKDILSAGTYFGNPAKSGA